ncbi:hypothetical protein O7627_36725 [Solwaraspora sp. WMMD1047]|uniref:trypco2 family protein n=1 Tax=Solwaraspora sp. WMMD1047 TaxID=3016102 RepID=UPI002415C412|nr:trypco2 family protein [Solwaraspora sp. WMMD1047]MDG4834815.1 hypothetical protein [Solwaraspora sp. WMMD1047]
MAETFGLAEVLGRLREDLEKAQADGAGSSLGLRIEGAEVELLVEVSRETAPGGKVKIDVVGFGGVEAGADATFGRSRTHRVTLQLAVTDRATGGPAEVADDRKRAW